jgi:SAM-dependent methyltransferase
MIETQSTDILNQSFLKEYNSETAVLKYSTKTAGKGVNYLIQHDYAAIYDQAIAARRQVSVAPLRILEFGCGAGMNLIGLVSRLQRRNISVDCAVGTDFSVALIESARREAAAFLPKSCQSRVSFHVARNESLSSDLARATGREASAWLGAFDLIIGVNTFRYCHRLDNARECAEDFYRMLAPGGTLVMIDMNDRFKLFRSNFRLKQQNAEEVYLPTLDEYARPFEAAGFRLLRKDHFCWIPHSAGVVLTAIGRLMTPVLDATIRSRAMRSLVIAQKPV